VKIEKVKKLIAVLIVLFMITSCFAVGMAIAAQDQTQDKERTRAGEDKNVAGGIEVLDYMEDFRGDSLKTTTKNQTKEREGKGYEDEEADSEVEGLSAMGDVTDDFSGSKKSARIASVVGGPLEISLHPLRCLSVTFPAVANIFVNETGWWGDGSAFNSSATPIQSAIDNASDGSTIYVYTGTYNESLNISTNLTLTGENRDTTVIDGMGSNCINVTAEDVEIKGFTIHNGSAGIYVEAEDASVTVVNNNITVNNYGGVQINATNSIVANITCNIISDNNVSCTTTGTGGGIGGIRMSVNASNGTIDATIRDNNIEYNRGGGIRIGRWNQYDLPRVCGNITALIDNNEISNNKDGSIRIGGAQDTITATLTDNYIGSVEQKNAGGLVRIGRSEECDLPLSPAVVNAVVSGNTIECGNASDEVQTGGIIRIGATDTLNATVNDNDMHGGYAIGGVIRIGHAGHPTNVTARVINNTLDFADGDDIGGIIRIRATDTLDATVNGNNITAGIIGDYNRDIGGVIRIGQGDNPTNVKAAVIGNYIYCANVTDERTYIGGFVRIRAEETLNATVNNNTIIGGNNIGGFIRIGHGEHPEDVTATVIGNYLEGLNVTVGKGTQVGGFVRIRAEDTLDATVNENTIIARNCSIGGVMRIGQDCQPENLTATVNNNEISITGISNTSAGDYDSGVGGVIRINAHDNLTTTVNENRISGEEEKGGYLLGGGIRIGNYDRNPTGNVTAVVNGNYIAPCKGGAIRIVAKDELNATVNDNTASGNYGGGIRIGYFSWACGNQSTAIVNATVINNTVTNNYGSGMHISAQDNLTAVIYGNILTNNTFCANPASGYVANGSGLIVEGRRDVTIASNNTFLNNALYGIYSNGITTLDANVTAFYAYQVTDPGEDQNFGPPPADILAYPLGFSLVATGPANQDVPFIVFFDAHVPPDLALYKILPSGEWQLIDPADYTIAGNVLTITLHFDNKGNLDPAFQFSSGFTVPTLTPLGLLALLGLLTVIAAISIVRKKEREGT
jgi:hypothetical protein